MPSLTGQEPSRGRGSALPQTGLLSPAHGQREGTEVRYAARPSPCEHTSKSLFRPWGGGGSEIPGAGLTPKHKERLSTRLPEPGLDLPAAHRESLPLK